jgi:cysteine desulfurase
VLAPAAQFNCSVALTTGQGRVDLDDLRAKIKKDTVLVSVMYANNEVGTLQPLPHIAAMLEEIRAQRRQEGNDLPLYFHTDACQAGNYLDLHVSRLGVDLMTLNGGKLYGPKQSGILYVASHVQIAPIIRGGGQEHNLRSGTENVAAAVGFAEALDRAQTMRINEVKRLTDLQNIAYTRLSEKLPQASINGSIKSRLPNNLHITIPGFDNERLLIQLEQAGILAAAGSACSASDEEPSHVLRAMGLSDADARSSLRFTMGRSTTLADIKTLIKSLEAIVGSKNNNLIDTV